MKVLLHRWQFGVTITYHFLFVPVPEPATGVVLFAHGSGSSRHSPRNRYVAGELQASGLAAELTS